MTLSKQVAEIAGKLPKAHREVVLGFKVGEDFAPIPQWLAHESYAQPIWACVVRGILSFDVTGGVSGYRFTPLGQQVRAHILAESIK